MTYQQLFFLGRQLIAEGSFECPNKPHSLVYFCPTCGDIWGRIVVFRRKLENNHWSLEHVPCREHFPSGVPDWGRVPGSFLLGNRDSLSTMWWGAVIEHLPQKVLAIELDCHINHYERQDE